VVSDKNMSAVNIPTLPRLVISTQKYEPLISKRLFDDLQVVLRNKAKPKKMVNDWPYAGLLKCDCGCGASVIFETKRKYYKKTNRWAEYTYARSSKRCRKCTQNEKTFYLSLSSSLVYILND